MNNIQTIADTIIWLAKEKFKEEPFQNINSAIHAVQMEVSLIVMKYMVKHKGE